MSNNKVKYGLKNVHYAVATENGGTLTYAAPVPVPGGVSITLEPKGEKAEFYADDGLYHSVESNQGYEGSLEMALMPDAFRIAVLGDKLDGNGALFEDVNARPKPIALLFEFNGDVNATRHALYYVHVSRPALAGKTTAAAVEVGTETLNMVASPAPGTGFVKTKLEAGKTGYDTFFAGVYTFVPLTP
ncbi:MAG: phage tail protein [Ammonifex sp.]|jgi:phi13 family phage major tail protein|nr:MAG: phage tail protein [Ammonifex sp.]